MKDPFISSDDYVKARGAICPFCKSADIEASNFELDGDGASAEAACNTCGATWYDYYKLSGFGEVDE